MKERPSSASSLHVRRDPLPVSDYSGQGVCSREREPGVEVDTLIIHSCYVEDGIIAPARMQEISSYSEENARKLYDAWKSELEAVRTTAASGVPSPDVQACLLESEFLAVHAMLRSRLPSEGVHTFSVAAIKCIFEFYGISAHYLIDREGIPYEFVSPELLAFHAGLSKMPRPEDGREKVNGFSIGVELLGTEHSGFTDAQYASLASLTKELSRRFPLSNFYGHSDIAPGRKADPFGFDWRRYQDSIGFDPRKHFSVS